MKVFMYILAQPVKGKTNSEYLSPILQVYITNLQTCHISKASFTHPFLPEVQPKSLQMEDFQSIHLYP